MVKSTQIYRYGVDPRTPFFLHRTPPSCTCTSPFDARTPPWRYLFNIYSIHLLKHSVPLSMSMPLAKNTQLLYNAPRNTRKIDFAKLDYAAIKEQSLWLEDIIYTIHPVVIIPSRHTNPQPSRAHFVYS